MISVDRLDEIRADCFLTPEEIEDGHDYVATEGIVADYGFHPERLESHREEVREMLMQLPDSFMASKGGGMSFLQACDDRDGNQWTGMHADMEMLFCLGNGLGLVKYPLPRDMWSVLPGGVPYVTVIDT